MGGQWDPHITPGGMALKFYSSIRLEVKRTDAIKQGENLVGQRIRFRIKKNKVSHKASEGNIDLFYDRGFDSQLNLLEAAMEKGVITRKGNSYFYDDIKLGIGKSKVMEYLENHPDLKITLEKNIKGG